MGATSWNGSEHLPEHGWAVLNGDEPRLGDWADRVKSQVLLVGRGSHCDLKATEVRSGQGELKFVVDGTQCTVPIWGRHALHAALAAFAVGRIMGLSAQRRGRADCESFGRWHIAVRSLVRTA